MTMYHFFNSWYRYKRLKRYKRAGARKAPLHKTLNYRSEFTNVVRKQNKSFAEIKRVHERSVYVVELTPARTNFAIDKQ